MDEVYNLSAFAAVLVTNITLLLCYVVAYKLIITIIILCLFSYDFDLLDV